MTDLTLILSIVGFVLLGTILTYFRICGYYYCNKDAQSADLVGIALAMGMSWIIPIRNFSIINNEKTKNS